MSYDFSFLCLTPYPKEFPFSPSHDFDGKNQVFKNTDELKKILLANGFQKSFSSSNDAQRFRWNTPDGGQLEASVRSDCINVNTYAHWRYVLDVYKTLCSVEPGLLILDDQIVIFYNATTYLEFINSSYAQKT
jgi:hypothetical protein